MIFRFAARKNFMEKYGDMQLPDALLKRWLISRNEELNEENIDARYENISTDLKWQLVKEQVAQKLEIKIEEADILNFAKGLAAQQFAQYGMHNVDEETIERYAKSIMEDKNYRNNLIEQVGDVKLFDSLAAAVTLKKEVVSLDQFKEIASKL